MPIHFIWRRLSTVAGIFPLLFFTFFYLSLFGKALNPAGPSVFDPAMSLYVEKPFHSLFHALLILIPFTFHFFYGLKASHPFRSSLAQTFRNSCLILAFIFLLLFYLTLGPWGDRVTDTSYLMALWGNIWLAPAFILGGAALWMTLFFDLRSALVDWGVTLGKISQKMVSVILGVMTGFFIWIHTVLVLSFFANGRLIPVGLLWIIQSTKKVLF